MDVNPPTSPLLGKKKAGEKRGLPSPKEMIAHYESKGMDTGEASVKVIEDLQSALFRKFVQENKKTKKNAGGPGADSSPPNSRKLDVINSRLIQLEMKVDSKPGYPQTLAIGVASGALLGGIGNLLPHLAASAANIWKSVTTAATSNH